MFTLYTFFELFVCSCIFVQLSDGFTARRLIHAQSRSQIFMFFLGWVCVIAVVSIFSRVLFSILLWSSIIILSLSSFFLSSSRRTQFRRELPILLSNLILKMRTGLSFRAALKASVENLSPVTTSKVEKIFENLDLTTKPGEVNQQQDLEVERLLVFFRTIDREAHKTLPRLCQFRNQIKEEAYFRSRVQRALSQLKAQSWVMGILYCALLVFVISKFGWSENNKLISLSFFLFATGQFLTIRLGRNFKWKV